MISETTLRPMGQTITDIAPMVILESTTDLFNTEQVIISHLGDPCEDLYISDGTSITLLEPQYLEQDKALQGRSKHGGFTKSWMESRRMVR